MTSKEFTIWLKGFITACNEYSPTPKQWDIIKEELEKVKDDTTLSPFPFGTPNTAPIMPLPHYPNPLDNPYRITCSSGSFGTITTTPGTGYITTYNPITFTASSRTSLPSGSNITYTNGGNGLKD